MEELREVVELGAGGGARCRRRSEVQEEELGDMSMIHQQSARARKGKEGKERLEGQGDQVGTQPYITVWIMPFDEKESSHKLF